MLPTNRTLHQALNRHGIVSVRTERTEKTGKRYLFFALSKEPLGDYDARDAWELVHKLNVKARG
jgi:hypothetical protein